MLSITRPSSSYDKVRLLVLALGGTTLQEAAPCWTITSTSSSNKEDLGVMESHRCLFFEQGAAFGGVTFSLCLWDFEGGVLISSVGSRVAETSRGLPCIFVYIWGIHLRVVSHFILTRKIVSFSTRITARNFYGQL